MFRNQTEAKKAIEAGGAQADIGDIEKDMNQVSLGKSMEGSTYSRQNLKVFICHILESTN